MSQTQETTGKGQIRISDDVVAVIAGTAASEAEGTVFPSNMLGKKNFGKGIRVHITENNAVIDVNLRVKFGSKIQEIAQTVQKNVKTAVETMTGLEVSQVNVNITGVAFSKSKREKAEASAE